MDQNGESPQRLSKVDDRLLSLFEHDKDEKLICQINKHPIGIFFIWTASILMFTLLIVAYVLILAIMPESITIPSSVKLLLMGIIGILAFLTLVGGYISAWVYQRSVLILTNEKLVQLRQRNLIDRNISQLSIGDIQDVTIQQKGILARIFKYGDLIIETAGEQVNYVFDHVPNPHFYSNLIVGAHEDNLKLYGN